MSFCPISTRYTGDGYLAFFTGSVDGSTAIAGDNDLFWDRENNRLGVGTSTPTEKLEIAGNIKVSGDLIIGETVINQGLAGSIDNVLAAMDGYFPRSGFVNRTDSSLSFTKETRTFAIAPSVISFQFFTNGNRFTKSTSQTKIISESLGLHYLLFDASGVLQESVIPCDITDPSTAICAIIYWNGTDGIVYDERHGYKRDPSWHQWAHDTIGTRYESGLTGTFTTSSISVLQGQIHDEDIEFSITPTQTSAMIWYKASGGATMTFDSTPSSIAAKVISGALKYDNNGTLDNVTNNAYATNWIYATTSISTPIMVVVSQAQYGNLAAARAAGLPTFPNKPSVEFKVIYQIIWRNLGGTPTYTEATDYRSSGTLPGGGITTPPANTITVTPSGTISSTNVQSALEELDLEKVYAEQAYDGYVAFFTRTNSIAGDNDLYWDRENNRLGIGTTTPGEKLEINGAIKIGAATNAVDGTVRWTGSDFEGRKAGVWASLTNGSITGSGSSGRVTFWSGTNTVSSSESIWWDNTNSRLGVGIIDPKYRLDVNGDINTNSIILLQRNDPNNIIMFKPAGTLGGNTKEYWLSTVRGSDGLGPDGSFNLWNQTDGKLHWTVTHDAHMGVGLGWSQIKVPAVPLHVTTNVANTGGETIIARLGSSVNDTNPLELIIRHAYESSRYHIDLVGARYGAAVEDIDINATMTVSNGKVGIGTTSPSKLLHVYKNDNSDDGIYIQNASTEINSRARLTFLAGGLTQGIIQARGTQIGDPLATDPSLYIISTAVGGSIVLSTNSTSERVRITNDGKLGIGTASPQHNLHVVGDALITGEIKNSILTQALQSVRQSLDGYTTSTGSTGDGYITFFTGTNKIAGDNDLYWNRENNSLAIGDSIIINKDGYIGAGTASPTVTLDVFGNLANEFPLHVFNDGDNANRKGIAIQCGKDTPETNLDCTWISFRTGDGTEIGYLAYNADSPYVSLWTASDQRLKTNIQPTKVNGLSALNNIQLKEFDWIDEKRSFVKIGYIAQQLQEILPELVSQNSDGYMCITDTLLTPYLVKAVQELSEKIENKDQIIADLVARLEDLESIIKGS